MAVRISGIKTWNMVRDDDGHRNYTITYRLESDTLVGPATIAQTFGLPIVGDWWIITIGTYTDVDLWAFCKQGASFSPEITDGEPSRFWNATYKFSTRPDEKRCHELQIEDPLATPDRVSITFIKYTEEATEDRFGDKILNSGFEEIRGPQVEFDQGRIVVRIDQNRADPQLDLLAEINNTVNDFEMWGFPPRTIKLTIGGLNKKFYGQCFVYWERSLEFEIRVETFDRDILDEGTKALNGHWDDASGVWVLDNIGGGAPDPDNPSHFKRITDREGNTMRCILNGFGIPLSAEPGTGSHDNPGNIHVEKYEEFTQDDIDSLDVPDVP